MNIIRIILEYWSCDMIMLSVCVTVRDRPCSPGRAVYQVQLWWVWCCDTSGYQPSILTCLNLSEIGPVRLLPTQYCGVSLPGSYSYIFVQTISAPKETQRGSNVNQLPVLSSWIECVTTSGVFIAKGQNKGEFWQYCLYETGTWHQCIMCDNGMSGLEQIRTSCHVSCSKLFVRF